MQSSRRLDIFLIILSSVLFGAIYLWFISIGTWVHLSQTSTYFYRMQADGFLAGTPALLQQPDPGLAQLENPYSREARGNIPISMDASYYRGKYYLYYGPVPAVLLAVFMSFFKHGISDGYFTLIGGLISYIFSFLIILKIRRKYFNRTPIWLTITSLAIIGFSSSILWVMNAGRIYEAAVSMGIAFVIAGLYFAFDTLDGERSNASNLLLAGLLFGMAIGTRLVLAGAVAILCAVMVLRLLAAQGRKSIDKKTVLTAILFLTPLLIVVFLLGWYNYIRFNNPFEPGYRYALTGVNVSDFSTTLQVFNIRFIPSNLYNYLLNPFGVIDKFPFLITLRANTSIYTSIFHTSLGYNPEFMTGMFVTAPLTVFIGYFVWYSVQRQSIIKYRHNINLNAAPIPKVNDFIITLGAVGLASFVSFIAILLYPVVSNRYFMDFAPLLNIVTISSLWLVYENIRDKTIRRRMVSSVILILASYSVSVGFLLALVGELNRFHFVV